MKTLLLAVALLSVVSTAQAIVYEQQGATNTQAEFVPNWNESDSGFVPNWNDDEGVVANNNATATTETE